VLVSFVAIANLIICDGAKEPCLGAVDSLRIPHIAPLSPIRTPSSFNDLGILCFCLNRIHQPLEKNYHCYWIRVAYLKIDTNELGRVQANRKDGFQSYQRVHDHAAEPFSLLDARIANRKSLLSTCRLALFRELGVATQRSIARYSHETTKALVEPRCTANYLE
jgi:hypothetical protein